MSEQWLPVVGFEGLYEVSSYGRVKGLPREKKQQRLSLRIMRSYGAGKHRQYRYVDLKRLDGTRRKVAIHVLVLEAFAGPRPKGTCARHLDGDFNNNTPANLLWGTYSENNYDIIRHGRGRWQRYSDGRRSA